MASVNFSELEYTEVAGAAMDAYRHGDMESARVLNELASKMNKALSVRKLVGWTPFGRNIRHDFRAAGPLDKEFGIVDATVDNGNAHVGGKPDSRTSGAG